MASLVVGCVIAIAYAGFAMLRALWPGYADAEPQKHYTLAMLCLRLGVGAWCTAGAAGATTIVAGDHGRAAWWLGALILVISIPSHLYPGYDWNDYPVWYHLVYLCYLVPIAGLTARVWRSTLNGLKDVAT